MASLSTVLLNVSEFKNIDDATQALVSITQAYKDIKPDEIINKINLIGNSFPISTDKLAQAMQQASAVLSTQKNNIDEAIALVTAGSLIGQDASQAAAGIRTISLRLSGTKEAQNELSQLGDSVDDFELRTQSKTDAIIKKYTAVASNAYQGVSVLDPNGNLKSTYDILLSISKIYKEIQEEDKRRGSNAAQGLVEVLAGHTASSTTKVVLKYMFNCVDCLKLCATIIRKLDYEGLIR